MGQWARPCQFFLQKQERGGYWGNFRPGLQRLSGVGVGRSRSGVVLVAHGPLGGDSHFFHSGYWHLRNWLYMRPEHGVSTGQSRFPEHNGLPRRGLPG
jgi:hypothetical protein